MIRSRSVNTPPFSLKTLQRDSNCIAIQDPSAVWGVQDFLPRRNLLLATDTLATQNVTVVATAYKLYCQGTGSITLSGTGSGTLQGTGANDRVVLSFTPTAGTLTLTVSGTVTFGMLTRADTLDQSYQKITDWTTEQYAWAAQKQVPWLRRNRFLSTATLSTQTVSSVTATPLTVSFKGTGTITFSTAYSGSLVGTGANDRVTATFTPSAGNLVCTVNGTVTEAQCEVAGAATEYQPILASWDATYTAKAIAAGYPISLWQDAAGTNAVNGATDNQPIGACRDLKYGDYGPELAVGGNFESGLGSWVGTNWSWGSGKVSHTAGATGSFRLENILTVGKTYRAFCTVSGRTAGTLSMSLGQGNLTTVSADGLIAVIGICAVDGHLRVTPSSDFNGSVDDFHCYEILGYTAIQSTAANQPKWRLDGNGKAYIERDLTNDSLPITLPNLGSNCVIYTAEQSVTLKDSGITLNGSYAPITPAVDYGRIIMAADSRYDAKILKYLDGKRGRQYSLGPELMTNGEFSSETGWNLQAGWAITGGKLVATSAGATAAAIHAGVITAGKRYRVSYTTESISGGSVYLQSSSMGYVGAVRTSAGVYSEIISPTTGSTGNIGITAASTLTASIDNVSVREVILS